MKYFAGPGLEAALKMGNLIVSAALALAMFALAGVVHAQDPDSCRQRIQRDRRDLLRAIEEHGEYSSQARHEREELERDAGKCRYPEYHDSDDGSRYEESPPQAYVRLSYQSPAFDMGYRDGFAIGQRDRERGKPLRTKRNDYYEDADHGYQRRFGNKGL